MDTVSNDAPVGDTTLEQDVTAAPVSTDTPPEELANDTPKSFTQEDLDSIVSKRLAREQRKWEREATQRATPPAAPINLPPADNFSSVEEYAKAYAEQRYQEMEIQRQRSGYVEAYHDKEEDARSKYDDFEQVAYNPNLRITSVMAETIQTSEAGPDVAYYLGTNPKEADRISRLQPIAQAKEIGKIEAKLAANPITKRSSSAPSPIAPVTARGSGSSQYDTTDPRSVKAMSTSDWIAAERQRQIKKMEAANRR